MPATEENRSRAIQHFALSLGHVTGFLNRAIHDDDLLSFFAERGISKTKLENAKQATMAVANVFYNEAIPA